MSVCVYIYITVAKFTITHVTIHKLDIGMHTYIYNGGKTTFDIYFIEFGTALTTILPILFQYCYKYCYSDSQNL